MQTGQTFSLSELIKHQGKEKAQFILEHYFRCSRSEDIERFLHKNAIRFELGNMARTYLVMDDNSDILAYFTLSFKSITVNTSKQQLKKLTNGLTSSNRVSVYLIAQIGKNSLIDNNPINLSFLFDTIFHKIAEAQEIIGGRSAILECENIPSLIAYYEKHNFKLIDTVGDSELKTMFIIPAMNEEAIVKAN